MKSGINWTCPFCNRPQTLTEEQTETLSERLFNDRSKHGIIAAKIYTFTCANPECLELTMITQLIEARPQRAGGDGNDSHPA